MTTGFDNRCFVWVFDFVNWADKFFMAMKLLSYCNFLKKIMLGNYGLIYWF